jgi:predicted Zn-dependent protease
MATVTAAILVAGAGSANANDFGGDCSTDPVCAFKNNHPAYWWSDSLNQNWRDAGNYATGRLDLSDVDTDHVANAENGDVHAFQGDYGSTSWVGASSCTTLSNDQKTCAHWNEFANNHNFSFTQDQRESLWCHEFGHTVGLHHYADHQDPDTCMETPHWHRDYNSHDRGHLNDYY